VPAGTLLAPRAHNLRARWYCAVAAWHPAPYPRRCAVCAPLAGCVCAFRPFLHRFSSRAMVQDSEQADTYCTAMCQEGVDRVSWHAHGVSYCAKSPGTCPDAPPIIPVDRYMVGPWTGKPPARMTCSPPPGGMPKVRVATICRGKPPLLTCSAVQAEHGAQVVVVDFVRPGSEGPPPPPTPPPPQPNTLHPRLTTLVASCGPWRSR
jgi:hypothetical protein